MKDESGSADGQFQKNYSGICKNGLSKHIQNLRQFTRRDSNSYEYEALTYTNIQLICSKAFNVPHVAALKTFVIFTHISLIP